MFTELILLVALTVLAYTWVGYPCMLGWVARRRQVRPADGPMRDGAGRPDPVHAEIAILLAAHNEEAGIARCLESLRRALASVPGAHAAIHIGLDGCSDRTAEVVRGLGIPQVRLHEFGVRRGKPAVIKELATLACAASPRPGILVFTDANAAFREDALTKLQVHFQDPAVGGVCGKLVLKGAAKSTAKVSVNESGRLTTENTESAEKKPREKLLEETQTLRETGRTAEGAPQIRATLGSETTPQVPSPCPPCPQATRRAGGESGPGDFVSSWRSSSDGPESLYWKMESSLKELESAVDSCLGANGAIYAVRAGLFWSDMPDNTIVDDFVIGMKVREQGYRMIYEPDAVAEEDLPESEHEWARRVRIGAGDFQALGLCRKCLWPSSRLAPGLFPWIFFSHKVLRWFTPHLGLVVLAASAGLAFAASAPPVWRTLSIGILALTGLALGVAAFGAAVPASAHGVGRVVRTVHHGVAMQAALLVGFFRFCAGNLQGHWERTPRGEG